MDYSLSRHAEIVLVERGIPVEWMERTLAHPELCERDPGDPHLDRRWRRIPEHGDRVLRVVVDTTIDPPRVISVFFDRGMKGKL